MADEGKKSPRSSPRKPRASKKAVVVGASTLPVNPDSLADQDVAWVGTGDDPYLEYVQEKDFFRSRRMLFSLAARCSATAAIANNLAADLAAQQVYIVPTVENPSATEMAVMRHTVALLNTWQMKPTGLIDAMRNFVQGYMWSKSGVFIAMPRVSRVVAGLLIVQPLATFPHYGWMVGPGDFSTPTREIAVTPTSGMFGRTRVDKWGNPINEFDRVQGVYYTDQGISNARYYELMEDEYYQICPGAIGYGAFQTARPRVESMLRAMVTHIALEDYLSGVILNTDEAQAVLWTNVSAAQLKAYSEKRKELRRIKRNGGQLPTDDSGLRIHVTAKDPSRPADVKAVNMRATPEGFDPDKMLRSLTETLCLYSGVNPRRATAGYMGEKFGNATLSAMLNNDEPAMREIRAALEAFVSGVLLAGVRASANMVAETSPENYAVVQRDIGIAQVISQVGPAFTPEQQVAYMQRMGLLKPAEAGASSMRAGDIGPEEIVSIDFQRSYASLRDRKGMPFRWEPPVLITARRKAYDVEGCTREATARYEEWIETELPTVVVDGRIDRDILVEEVDQIANEVWSDIARCYRAATGVSQSERVRSVLNYMRAAWLIAMASPFAQPPVTTEQRPQNNLYMNLWSLAGRVAMGAASTAALQAEAATFTSYIARYMNAIRAGENMDDYEQYDGPVTWVRNAQESCRDCIQFEGAYASVADMLRRTGGLMPGDLRLTCSGNCKCELLRSGG